MKVLVMASQSDRHLDEQQLESYSMGTTSNEEASQFAEHLRTCETCRQQLGATDAYVGSMRRAGARLRAAPQEERRTRSLSRFAPILAAALAVLAIGLGLRFWQPVRLSPVAVTLATTRGNASAAQARAGRPLLLQPDLEGLTPLPSYALEMVDSRGRRLWQGVLRPSASGNRALAPAARTGLYFVRVYTPAGALLREYALQIGVPR